MKNNVIPTHVQSKGRLYNLDYLRGLAAFGIMLYHYFSWTFGGYTADTFIERVGIYGVSIFYVLSGLTLYYVYCAKMKPSFSDVAAFFRKRIFRIFPLLWLVTIASIILLRSIPNLRDLALNLTGLFGFVKWDTYFATGAWSIGNELVFYVFLPFFVYFARSKRSLLVLLSAVIFSLYLYFAFAKLDPQVSLAQQWKSYVNPLNQVFLFLGGFLIGLVFHHTKIKQTVTLALLAMGVGAFIAIPAHGDAIALVTGINRLLFTFCCFLVCFCFYKLTLKFPVFIHKPLTLLGEASYSVYLLHPIVRNVMLFVSNNIFPLSPVAVLILSVVITLAASWVTYEYFEKYFMKLGKKTKTRTSVA